MSQIHEHPHGPGPHSWAPWSTMPPPSGAPGPFPYVPSPRRSDAPPAGPSYGYGPPTAYGAGPHVPLEPPTSWMPPASAPASRGRTAVIAIVLSLVILGGIVVAVAIMGQAVRASSPAAPVPGPAAPPAPSGVPSSPYTLTSMFAGNGSCSPTTADEQLPLVAEGLACGAGDGTAFLFFRYTGPAEDFQDTLVREWGGSGLTQRAQDDCRTQYTGTVDVPGTGATPVVVDIYRHSPFMVVTAAGNGAGAAPDYRVADRGSLCAGG